jgi:hypothetical protein
MSIIRIALIAMLFSFGVATVTAGFIPLAHASGGNKDKEK